jgi:hypothetical protein
MKQIFIFLVLGCLIACNGNETAESKPTDLDRTKNNDTSVVATDSPYTATPGSADTTHAKK